MEEILEKVGLINLLVLGVLVVSFTECTKLLLPDKIENKLMMGIAVIYGNAFGIGMHFVGMIETIQMGIILGTLTAGVITGSIKFLFKLIGKLKK